MSDQTASQSRPRPKLDAFKQRLSDRFWRKRPRRLPVSVRLMLGLVLLIGMGTVVFYGAPGVTTRPFTFLEALFTATSAATVTGLAVVSASTDFTLLGQFFLLLLIQAGGVGYMVLAVLLLQFLGRRISLADRLATSSSLGLQRSAEIEMIVSRGVLLMLLIEGIGAAFLYLHWSVNNVTPPGLTLFYAVFHAVSAFCNAGYDLFSGLPQYAEGLPVDNSTLIILGGLIVAGGLGIPVYSDLANRKKRFSLHTRVTLATIVVLISIGWIGLLLEESKIGGVLYELPLADQLVQTLFQSISTRTAGFPGMNTFDQMGQSSRLLVMALMFIGSGPASMGGGITTGTFAVLVLTLISYARGSRRVELQGRTLPNEIVIRAAAVLTISTTVVIVATWLLLITHNFTLDKALFEVISALATCGLSLGITGELNAFGQLIIIAIMFWGRLGVMTIVVAILQRRNIEQLVEYPEESILIG